MHCRVRKLIAAIDSGGDQESLGKPGTPSERVVIAENDQETITVMPSKPIGGQVQKKSFEFERVYSPNNTQEDVFKDVAPLLTSLLDG